MKLKKCLIIGATTLALAPTVSASLVTGSIYADQISTEQLQNNSTTYSVNSTIEINNEVYNSNTEVEFLKSIGVNPEAETVTITDGQLYLILKRLGLDTPESKALAENRAAGVTKVYKRGKKSWDIYLSAGFIKAYYGTLTVAGTGLTTYFSLIPGIGWAVATSMATALAGLVTADTKDGVVIQIRENKVVKVRKQ